MITAITDSISEAAKIIAMINETQPVEEWMNLTVAMHDTLADGKTSSHDPIFRRNYRYVTKSNDQIIILLAQ